MEVLDIIFIIVGLIVGLILLNIISEFYRTRTILINKEMWELSKYDVERVKIFLDRKYELVTDSQLEKCYSNLDKRLSIIELKIESKL